MTDYRQYIGFKGKKPEDIKETFRASNGVLITEALFEETIQASSREKYEPLYSLREYENKGKPSAYQIYINSIDEADAALKLVGSYAHWRKLCSLSWFIKGRSEIGFEGLAKWRLDMAERDMTFAKTVLQEQALSGNVSAARALEKMASDEYKRAIKVSPRESLKTVNSDPDFDFLDKYGK